MDPLRVAVLASRSAAGIGSLLADPNRGVTWDLVHESDAYDDRRFADVGIDYVLLLGQPPAERLLSRFDRRVFALHHADLSLNDRWYAGPHPVRDAVLAGEPETRTSVYVVTGEAARGPLFLLSGAFPVAPMALSAHANGDADFLTRYADLHEQWMAAESDGPMLVRTLELLAGGTTQIVHDVVWVDGAPGPCRMGEAPRACHEPAIGIPRSCPFIR